MGGRVSSGRDPRSKSRAWGSERGVCKGRVGAEKVLERAVLGISGALSPGMANLDPRDKGGTAHPRAASCEAED